MGSIPILCEASQNYETGLTQIHLENAICRGEWHSPKTPDVGANGIRPQQMSISLTIL
ncbi:MAG: hypothetical protein F6K24_32850 [Okeania sp. SIO2D1]|nr:hypothetical protein [Okeania sp. SIO2D1]